MMLARASFCCEGFRIFGWTDDAAGAGGGAFAPSMRQLHRCTASWPPALLVNGLLISPAGAAHGAWSSSNARLGHGACAAGRWNRTQPRSEIGHSRRRQRVGAVRTSAFELCHLIE